MKPSKPKASIWDKDSDEEGKNTKKPQEKQTTGSGKPTGKLDKILGLLGTKGESKKV